MDGDPRGSDAGIADDGHRDREDARRLPDLLEALDCPWNRKRQYRRPKILFLDSNWKEILEYFKPAFQLGLAATPWKTGR